MSIVEDKPAATRPSLYAAIRLARLVLNFRARLKARVQRRGLSIKPFIADQKESFKIQAYKAINRVSKPRRHSDSEVFYHANPDVIQGQQLKTSRLLGDIDSYAKPGSLSVTTVAAQDSLFLQHDVQKLANGLSIVGLRHLLDRIILVLEALQSLKNARAEPQGTSARDLACHDYTCEKFIANLEHLLQCLGDVVFEAIIYHKQIEKEVDDLHWYKYWRQQRETDDGWFSEWPNSRHPLSTTWPWNVKPSLLVLWGVCWMFFDNEASNEGEDLGNGNNIWPQRQQPRRIANPNLNLANWMNNTNSDLSDFFIGAQVATGGNLNNGASGIPDFVLPGYEEYTPASSSYRSVNSTLSSATFSTPTNAWLDNQNIDISSSYNYDNCNWQTPFSNPQHQGSTLQNHSRGEDLFSTPCSRPTSTPYSSESPLVYRTEGTRNNNLSLQIPMNNLHNYPPSPHSENSNPGISPCSTSYRNSGLGGSPSTIESREGGESAVERKMSHEPAPRHADGTIYCDREECATDPPVFLRKCEWTKHMDKHTRPYLCEEPGCEKIRGFTYSGGLLRHQREVHKKHGGPKVTCMCPFQDCKRSTGTGFSRKENLHEHLRRVHRDSREPANPQPAVVSPSPSKPSSHQSLGVLGRKRRRGPATVDDGDGRKDDGAVDEAKGWKEEVKRLRKEGADKDERLRRLERTVLQLQQMAGVRVRSSQGE